MAQSRAKMTSQLPATPVTPEMRDSVVAIADREKRSISDIVRQAISLFLSNSDSKAINIVSNATVESEVQS